MWCCVGEQQVASNISGAQIFRVCWVVVMQVLHSISYWETRNFSYITVTVSNLALFVSIVYECLQFKMWVVCGKEQNAGISLLRLFCNVPSSHWGEVYLHLCTNSPLDWGGWPMPCPDHFTPRKDIRCLLTGGWACLGASLDESRKSCPPPGFQPWTIQSIASHYSNSAILASISLRTNQSCHTFSNFLVVCIHGV
jgi:hypothetical protein